MCDDAAHVRPLRRRTILRAGFALGVAPPLQLVLGTPVSAAPPAEALAGLAVHPREDWADGRAATGPLRVEADGDVRFLLVHHSASSNAYDAADVPGLIRSFYAAHTGGKGWPDVAYNFFVDRFGEIWEGRTGSLAGPVIADATGGNQGFSQLCCLIGDHRIEPPTAAALDSLSRLLAALADRHGIDTAPGATATFISRGSNRWPRGETVTAGTIAGHRDMSRTECPGDACYRLIPGTITERVNLVRRPDAAAKPEAVPITATAVPPLQPTGAVRQPSSPSNLTGLDETSSADAATPLVIGGSSLAALTVAGLALWRRRSRHSAAAMTPPDGPPQPRRMHWEAAHAVGRDGNHVGSTVVDVVAHGPGTLVALLAVCDAATHDVARAAAAESVRLACEQLDAETDTIEAVTHLMSIGSPRPVAAVVAGPAQTAVAAIDPDSAVILTTDDRIYRPRASRSRTAAPMARAILDSREVGVVVLALPPATWLPDLARDAMVWPNVQLGARNYVLSRAPDTAVVVCVNRSALRQQVRAALADGTSPVGPAQWE